MISGIIICHGRLAFELVNSVGKILGQADQIFPFSNDDLTPQDLYTLVKERIAEEGIEQMYAFVDLRGGSCWRVAKMLARDYPELKIASGVNIPMLISFLSKRQQMDGEELQKTLDTDAHRSIIFE